MRIRRATPAEERDQFNTIMGRFMYILAGALTLFACGLLGWWLGFIQKPF